MVLDLEADKGIIARMRVVVLGVVWGKGVKEAD
jgi:hypothetical protein